LLQDGTVLIFDDWHRITSGMGGVTGVKRAFMDWPGHDRCLAYDPQTGSFALYDGRDTGGWGDHKVFRVSSPSAADHRPFTSATGAVS
jgi:hypothetical protein